MSFFTALWARLQALFIGVRAVAIKDEQFIQAILTRDLGALASTVRAAENSVLATIKSDVPAVEAAAKKAAADVIAAIESVLQQAGL